MNKCNQTIVSTPLSVNSWSQLSNYIFRTVCSIEKQQIYWLDRQVKTKEEKPKKIK